MTERNGERRDHPPTEPAPAVTSKARSDEWVYDVRAGGHAAGYSRPGGAPAPTLTAAGLATGRDVIRPKLKLNPSNGRDRTDGGGPTPRGEDEPAFTLTGEHHGQARWVDDRPTPRDKGADTLGLKDPDWPEKRPSTTVAGDPRIFQPGNHREDVPGEQSHNAVRVTEQEAAILQSFPPDYPFQGSRSKRFEQIGNAVPPLLAEAILRALLGEEAKP